VNNCTGSRVAYSPVEVAKMLAWGKPRHSPPWWKRGDAHQSTAPIAGAAVPSSGRQEGPIPGPGVRSTPNSLIPNRYCLPSGSAPLSPLSLQSPLALVARDAKTPRADEEPEKSPILDRGLACLTTHWSTTTILRDEAGCLFFLYPNHS